MANNFWVLVGDGSRARFFRGKSPNSELEEFNVLDNPITRQHEGDMVSDQPGSFRDDAAVGSKETGMSQGETRVKENEMKKFANRVAEELDRASSQNEFSHLSLVAEPKFLGNLRKSLNKSTKEKVIEEVSKNLAEADEEAIRSQLEKLPSGFK